MELFVYSVDESMYALPLSIVERVYPSAQVVRVQDAPESVVGIIDIQGAILPVLSFKKLIGLDAREASLDDKFVVMTWKDRRVVLVVDKVFPATEVDEKELIPANDVMPGDSALIGVVTISGQLVLVQGIDELMAPLDGHVGKIVEGCTHALP